MRIKVEYTIDVPDNIRRGINIYYGKPGLATRDEVKDWYRAHGSAQDLDLAFEANRENDPDPVAERAEDDQSWRLTWNEETSVVLHDGEL